MGSRTTKGQRLTKPAGMSDFDWDNRRSMAQYGKPLIRYTINTATGPITKAYFPGHSVPIFYGGEYDRVHNNGLYGNRLPVSDARVAAQIGAQHPRMETFGDAVAPVKQAVVNGAHAIGRFGQETASNWSDAVDDDKVAVDNWAKTHLIPEPVRKKVIGPPKAPSIGPPNHWRQFVNNPGGTIVSDTAKVVGGAIPSTIGLLNTRQASDLSTAMGPVPEAIGTSLGALMTMSTNPKVGVQGLRQAMTKLFMHDLPSQPVGTILSAIPFLDIPKVARETGGATATKFYAARDSAIAEANARAQAGDRAGAAKLRNQAAVFDALGKAVGKPAGANPDGFVSGKPSASATAGYTRQGPTRLYLPADIANQSRMLPSSILSPGWQPPDLLNPTDRIVADIASPPGLGEPGLNSGASAKGQSASHSPGNPSEAPHRLRTYTDRYGFKVTTDGRRFVQILDPNNHPVSEQDYSDYQIKRLRYEIERDNEPLTDRIQESLHLRRPPALPALPNGTVPHYPDVPPLSKVLQDGLPTLINSAPSYSPAGQKSVQPHSHTSEPHQEQRAPRPPQSRVSGRGFGHGLKFVLQAEGGLTDDPDDPGGRTNKGILQREYNAYLREKYGKSVHRDVANITDAEVQDIYRHKYWDRVHGDELPGKVADIVFDEAVNQGNGQAIRDIGRALGIRNAPKHWTPEVEARLHQVRNPEELARKIVQLRREDYEDIVHRRPKSRKFLRGWNNRLNNIENYENQNH
jgi:hypothetical protein